MKVRLTLILSLLVIASVSIHAQEIRERQITPAEDLATMQSPVEIVSIKLNGKEILPGEKIEGNDNWLQGIVFTVKNVSDQPISYVNLGFKFPLPNGFVVVCVLNYGPDSSRGEVRRTSSPPVIQPGQTIDLVLTKDRYKMLQHVLAQANAPSSFDTAPYFIERVSFENQPDVIWHYGYLCRRNSSELGTFDAFEKYVLPIKRN